MSGFGDKFICHRRDNTEKCGQYLAGLLHDCKSNIERMSEQVSGSEYNQLHHFISESPWDSLGVMDVVAEKVYAKLSATSKDGEIGLLLDESGWEKSGKKSVGVSRQYIGQVGKVANGQVGVFAALSSGEDVGLVQGRLYLPLEWSSDSKRCDKAGVPTEEQVYRSKPELAVEILKTLPASVGYRWVGGDCIYGNSPVLREYLYSKKQSFVMDISSEHGVYLSRPELYIPPRTSTRGREPSRTKCDQKPIIIKDLLKQIPEKDWQTIHHRNGTKGALIRRATMINVYLWNPTHGSTIESVNLVISTEVDGSEIKFSLCYDAQDQMSLATALYRQMQRYWVERAFQNIKVQLGMHDYQVRTWRAWYHHIALSLMALDFLLEVKHENADDMPLLSVPDIKLFFAKTLLNKLNSEEALTKAILVRHRKRKNDIDRHFKVPK